MSAGTGGEKGLRKYISPGVQALQVLSDMIAKFQFQGMGLQIVLVF
jgi:hypothetical protein